MSLIVFLLPLLVVKAWDCVMEMSSAMRRPVQRPTKKSVLSRWEPSTAATALISLGIKTFALPGI